MTAVLEVEELRVTLPTPSGPLRAVRGVDLEVARGETLAVVGESGCGKSMTALAVMGLLPRGARREAQRIALAGEELTHLSERRMARLRGRRMAMIFQEPMTALNPAWSVGEQMTEHARRHEGLTRREAETRAVRLLERVGIPAARDRMAQHPHQLSGGLRQRVMIAMSLMCEPELLIADEPTTALDVTIQAQILHLLKELQAEMGLALLLVTHDLGVVARTADQVAVMYAGQVVERAAAPNLLARPTHPYTRGLLACLPRPGKGLLPTIPGVVPSLIGEVRGCAFRDRCPHAHERCAADPVDLRPAERAHAYRCVLEPDELRASGAWGSAA